MRGGLDDALDKLARRDELRRRAAGEATGTPPPVQDLVEAIAVVVSRNPAITVTVGVEGAGDPVLLHFAVEGGIVQVSADNTVASRVAEAAPTSPRHADFDIDLDDSVEESYPHPGAPASGTGPATRRTSYGDTVFPAPNRSSAYPDGLFASHRRTEPADGRWTDHRGTAGEPAAPGRMDSHGLAEQHAMPTPMPAPVPLKVDTAQTELAAKRLAALLRDNPTLLRPSAAD